MHLNYPISISLQGIWRRKKTRQIVSKIKQLINRCFFYSFFFKDTPKSHNGARGRRLGHTRKLFEQARSVSMSGRYLR